VKGNNMASKKVTISDLLRADSLRAFCEGLSFEAKDVDSIVLVVKLKDGTTRCHWECASIYEALGMLEISNSCLSERIGTGL
jgi:hypothetical protein